MIMHHVTILCVCRRLHVFRVSYIAQTISCHTLPANYLKKGTKKGATETKQLISIVLCMRWK